MSTFRSLSRRSFLAFSAAAPFALRAASSKAIPVGLELYSVRDDLKKDLMGTVESVAKMGYQCVEFYAPYYDWTPAYARDVRAKLNDLNLKCYSTHNDRKSFQPDGWDHAIELNQILGCKYIVLAHPGTVTGMEGWKNVADTLNQANKKFAAAGMHAGYHNHDIEWKKIDGELPLALVAKNTDKSIAMQFDIGPCLESGNDPVAWIKQNPGRIRSMHCKDWAPGKGFKVLLGEGIAQWPKVMEAAETTGGIEYYLIEQEGSDLSAMDTVRVCLDKWRKLRA